MQLGLGGVAPWTLALQSSDWDHGLGQLRRRWAGMRALCLPVAMGELFHPFALCWLLPQGSGALLHH